MDVNKRDNITVITTGGTIDKSYCEDDGSLLNRESYIKNLILKKLRLPYTYLNIFSVLNKDSLDMTEVDRELLLSSVKSHEVTGGPIVILHGTDTMALSANYIFKKLTNPEVAIVFTGAMKPMGFDDSDARQNVTEALLASKILPAGVYISFHNRIFNLPNVQKNKLTKTFEAI